MEDEMEDRVDNCEEGEIIKVTLTKKDKPTVTIKVIEFDKGVLVDEEGYVESYGAECYAGMGHELKEDKKTKTGRIVMWDDFYLNQFKFEGLVPTEIWEGKKLIYKEIYDEDEEKYLEVEL